jgi:hypothetical protein
MRTTLLRRLSQALQRDDTTPPKAINFYDTRARTLAAQVRGAARRESGRL